VRTRMHAQADLYGLAGGPRAARTGGVNCDRRQREMIVSRRLGAEEPYPHTPVGMKQQQAVVLRQSAKWRDCADLKGPLSWYQPGITPNDSLLTQGAICTVPD